MEDLAGMSPYITVNEATGGVPVFKGTDVAVKTLFEYLRDGTLYEFLEEYPSVSQEQAEALIELVVATDFL